MRSPVTGQGKYELCVFAIDMISAQLMGNRVTVVCMNYISLMWGAQVLDKGIWVVCMCYMYDVSPVSRPRMDNCMYELYALMWGFKLLDKGLSLACICCMYVTRSWSNSCMYSQYVWCEKTQLLDNGVWLVCMCFMYDMNPVTGRPGVTVVCMNCVWCEKPSYWAKAVWFVCMCYMSPVAGQRSNICMYELYVWCKEPSYWTREYQLCVCAICVMWAQLLGQGLIILCANYMFDVRSPVTG